MARPAPLPLRSDFTPSARAMTFARAVTAMGRSAMGGVAEAVDLTEDRAARDIIERGAVVPYTTSGSPLVPTSIEPLPSLLGQPSAIGQLITRCHSAGFNVLVPNATASATGVTFVAEGSPHKVRQFTFDGVTLTPLKLGFIATMTREVVECTSIEPVVRDLIARDLSLGAETILLDDAEGTTVRPAGLLHDVGAISAVAGGGIDAMTGDLANLASAVAAVGGMDLFYIAAPKEAVKIMLRTEGRFPYPLAASGALADGVVVCIAIPALVFAGGNDPPRISVSRESVLHMDDSPVALHGDATATPVAAAYPIRSLYQTDCVAVRLTTEINWALRAAGGIAWTESVTW